MGKPAYLAGKDTTKVILSNRLLEWDTMTKWCEEHCDSDFDESVLYAPAGKRGWHFLKESDATLFALKWS